MIEVRKTTLSPFSEYSVRMARKLYAHCPDCGGHTRMMVIRGAALDGAIVQGPPPAQLFYCDRCELALVVIYDPSKEVAIEKGIPNLLEDAGMLRPNWKG